MGAAHPIPYVTDFFEKSSKNFNGETTEPWDTVKQRLLRDSTFNKKFDTLYRDAVATQLADIKKISGQPESKKKSISQYNSGIEELRVEFPEFVEVLDKSKIDEGNLKIDEAQTLSVEFHLMEHCYKLATHRILADRVSLCNSWDEWHLERQIFPSRDQIIVFSLVLFEHEFGKDATTRFFAPDTGRIFWGYAHQ